MAMNLCVFQGGLVRDPEISTGTRQDGEAYVKARFTLGVGRVGTETSDYPEFYCFGKAAEFVEKYLKKGTQVIVESSFETGSYTNKDGKKVYTSVFRARDVRFS